jgi:hypothetical protein
MFIERRVFISQWVKEFMENVRAIDPSEMVGIDIPAGDTAEELLPSLFVEPFDHAAHEKYLQELDVVESLRLKVNEVATRLNEETIKCLQRWTAES